MCMLHGPLQLVSNSGGNKGDFIAVAVASVVIYRVYWNNTISSATRQVTDNFPAVH